MGRKEKTATAKSRPEKAGGKAAVDGERIDRSRLSGDAEALAAREGASVLALAPQAPEITVAGVAFDLDTPVLAPQIAERALGSAGYPYEAGIKTKIYEEQLRLLQIELAKLQRWTNETGARVVLIFEGRDAAGKGGTIGTFRAYMNPRSARTVALPKPSDVERGQWYFQRYIAQLPTRGEIVLFDRSWYNRAVVEPVMGFCSPAETAAFLREVPHFETMLVNDGIILVKFWLEIGREMQLKRFHDRRHDPLKVWKLSPVDIKALARWDDYTAARNAMMAASHTEVAPWTVVKANDKKRARLNAIRHVLQRIDYTDKNPAAIGETDPNLLGQGADFLAGVSD